MKDVIRSMENVQSLYFKSMLRSQFQDYKGHDGELVILVDTDPKEQYVWCSSKWEPVGVYSSKCSDNDDAKVERTNCPHCGAPLDLDKRREDGTCKCSFCRSFVKVIK